MAKIPPTIFQHEPYFFYQPSSWRHDWTLYYKNINLGTYLYYGTIYKVIIKLKFGELKIDAKHFMIRKLTN